MTAMKNPQYSSEKCMGHKSGFEGCMLAYNSSSQDDEVIGFLSSWGKLAI